MNQVIKKFYSENKTGVFIALVFAITSLPCIKWGLPSDERSSLVLPDLLKTQSFYELLKVAREKIYIKVGGNPSSYAGTMIVLDKNKGYDAGVTRYTPSSADGTVELSSLKGDFPNEILLAVNSFLLRTEHPHEQEMLNAIAKMNPRELDFNPRFYRYGGSYIYTLAAVYFIAAKIGYLHLVGETTYYMSRPGEMAKFYILGRALSLFCGGLMVFFTYAIAKKLYGGKIALLSSLFVALLPVVFVDSCTMRPQVYAAMWAMCGIYLALHNERLDFRRAILCGICFGLALGAALNSWIYLMFPAMVYWTYEKKVKLISKKFIAFNLVVFASSLAAYFATNPYVIFNLKDFFNEIRWMSTFRRTNWLPVNFFVVNLRQTLGDSFFVVFALGLIYRLFFAKIREAGDKILLSFTLPSVLYVAVCFGGSVEVGSANLRYHLPLVILMCVFVAAVFGRMISSAKIARAARLWSWLALILSLIPIGINRAAYSFWFYKSGSGDSTNLRAGRWINENIPRASKIGILKYTPHTDSSPPFRFTDYIIVGDYERALVRDDSSAVGELSSNIRLTDYFIVMKNPDYEHLRRISHLKYFLDRHYTIAQKFESQDILFKFFRVKNIFGYGEQTIDIYKLKKE